MSRKWVLFIYLFFSKVTFAESERFLFEDLDRYHSDIVHYYPPTVCALKALLGNEYDAMISRENGFSGGAFDWEKAPEAGSVVYVHHNWGDDNSYAAWLSKTGAMIVATRDGKRLKLYSNDRSLKKVPPKAIVGWLKDQTKAESVITWIVPNSE